MTSKAVKVNDLSFKTRSDKTNSESQSLPLKPLIFGSLAAAFEWYDYALFGYFTAIIATQFFPSADPITSLLSTFGVFASGFLMRPLGAILFGYIGDRIGRKYALGASLLLMAVPTTALGLLPTYNSIGIWAPIGLVIIRLLQGLSVGGNYGGSFIFTIESAPEGQKGFAGSLPSLGTLGGMFLGSGVASLLSTFMTEADLLNYGWRIPFLLGSLSALVGLAIRYFIKEELESPKEPIAQTPFQILWHHHLMNLIRAIGIILLDGIGIYVAFVFMTTFATVFLMMPVQNVQFINAMTMALLVVTIPFFGWLGDRWGARLILKIVSLGYLGFSMPLFWWLVTTKSVEALWSFQLVFAILMGAVYGAAPITISNLFPREVRYTAAGLSFNVSIAVFGGTAPLVITGLIGQTDSLMIPAFALTLVGAVSFISLGVGKSSAVRE